MRDLGILGRIAVGNEGRCTIEDLLCNPPVGGAVAVVGGELMAKRGERREGERAEARLSQRGLTLYHTRLGDASLSFP